MPQPFRKVKDSRKVRGQPAANRAARALAEERDPVDPGPAVVEAAAAADRGPAAEVPGVQVQADQVQAAEVPGGQVRADQVPAAEVPGGQVRAVQVPAVEVPVVPAPVAEVAAAIHRKRTAGFSVLHSSKFLVRYSIFKKTLFLVYPYLSAYGDKPRHYFCAEFF